MKLSSITLLSLDSFTSFSFRSARAIIDKARGLGDTAALDRRPESLRVEFLEVFVDTGEDSQSAEAPDRDFTKLGEPEMRRQGSSVGLALVRILVSVSVT